MSLKSKKGSMCLPLPAEGNPSLIFASAWCLPTNPRFIFIEIRTVYGNRNSIFQIFFIDEM